MSWDPTWEQVFRARDWGRYPPEELIRFVARNFFRASERKQIKILEVGCGAGANLWFLAHEGFDAYGVDASETAIVKARRRLQEDNLSAQFQVGDIVTLTNIFPGTQFDAVIDVACLQHNRPQTIPFILDQIWSVLKPHGRMFSMMVARGSYGDGLGTQVEPGTWTDIREGPMHGMGLAHFSTIDEIQPWFGRFVDVQVEYSERSMNNQTHSYKHWVIEAIKS